jgi:hypothetical protein
MQWIRTNRQFGAWCALVAVALQIVLSFGHIHSVDGVHRDGLFQAGTAVHAWAGQNPASDAAGLAAEYCTICAVIKMAASSAPPEAAGPGVPVMASGARFDARHTEAAWTLAHLLFQARAPPSAWASAD